MKTITLFTLLTFSGIFVLGQGQNSPYDFDLEDLKEVFREQGIYIFKFPFERSKDEYISISYEIYEDRELIARRHIIEDFQREHEITFNHHHSNQESIDFLRLYFFKEKDSLKMRQVLPGFKSFQKIDISKVAVSDFAAKENIDTSLNSKETIMFYYALYSNSERLEKSNGWLKCATGKSNKDLIDNYDLVVLFFAERIDAERAKKLLGEDFYKNISCPIPNMSD
jgi:hypothetical protein